VPSADAAHHLGLHHPVTPPHHRRFHRPLRRSPVVTTPWDHSGATPLRRRPRVAATARPFRRPSRTTVHRRSSGHATRRDPASSRRAPQHRLSIRPCDHRPHLCCSVVPDDQASSGIHSRHEPHHLRSCRSCRRSDFRPDRPSRGEPHPPGVIAPSVDRHEARRPGGRTLAIHGHHPTATRASTGSPLRRGATGADPEHPDGRCRPSGVLRPSITGPPAGSARSEERCAKAKMPRRRPPAVAAGGVVRRMPTTGGQDLGTGRSVEPALPKAKMPRRSHEPVATRWRCGHTVDRLVEHLLLSNRRTVRRGEDAASEATSQ